MLLTGCAGNGRLDGSEANDGQEEEGEEWKGEEEVDRPNWFARGGGCGCWSRSRILSQRGENISS